MNVVRKMGKITFLSLCYGAQDTERMLQKRQCYLEYTGCKMRVLFQNCSLFNLLSALLTAS